jgi:hypothetical protein
MVNEKKSKCNLRTYQTKVLLPTWQCHLDLNIKLRLFFRHFYGRKNGFLSTNWFKRKHVSIGSFGQKDGDDSKHRFYSSQHF